MNEQVSRSRTLKQNVRDPTYEPESGEQVLHKTPVLSRILSIYISTYFRDTQPLYQPGIECSVKIKINSAKKSTRSKYNPTQNREKSILIYKKSNKQEADTKPPGTELILEKQNKHQFSFFHVSQVQSLTASIHNSKQVTSASNYSSVYSPKREQSTNKSDCWLLLGCWGISKCYWLVIGSN